MIQGPHSSYISTLRQTRNRMILTPRPFHIPAPLVNHLANYKSLMPLTGGVFEGVHYHVELSAPFPRRSYQHAIPYQYHTDVSLAAACPDQPGLARWGTPPDCRRTLVHMLLFMLTMILILTMLLVHLFLCTIMSTHVALDQCQQ